jgi:hypothetical protein
MKRTAVSNISKLRSMGTPIGHPRITQNGICTNIHQDNLNFVLESNCDNYKKLKEIYLMKATEEMSLDYKYVPQ